ncbi:GNAT family N-acetyltransferase [Nocardioides sp. NPDC087217]|uniref:GNAT family N-acetyltransferase n=1 Tax=Nocardioides sp. NPDC087217 TaxID=3364335 RepID=UPI0037F600CA
MFSIDLGNGAEMVLRDRSTDFAVHKLINANLDHLRAWEPWAHGQQTMLSVAGFGTYLLGQWVKGEAIPCVIRQDGQVAGATTARINLYEKSATIGYWLGEAYEGRGLITRAVSALLDTLFNEYDIARAIIDTSVMNKRSRAVAERLGFTHEGTMRGAQAYPGERRDLVVYGLLREEWLTRSGRDGA